MGLMDKFKDQMAQGQELAKQAGVHGGDADPGAGRLRATGDQGRGERCSLQGDDHLDYSDRRGRRGNKEYAIAVTVEGNGDTYDATINQYLTDEALPSYQAGTAFEAKADPDERSRLLLFGLAS